MTDQTKSNFPAMLKQFQGEISRALPKHLNADRMSRIALTAFRRTPKLNKCDPRSVFAAVIQASQLGLEIDTQGRAFLIPYGRECQFIPGWKGLVDLTNRSGQATVWTGAVFEGDVFDYQLGDSPFASHKPCGESNPKSMTHVYAVGRVKNADWPVIEVWPIARVWQHRDRYNKVGKAHYSFKNEEMYARKVVLLQVLKYMPMSSELSTAIALNDAAEIGEQHLTIDDAIDGTWAHVPDDGANEQNQTEIKAPQSKSESKTKTSTKKKPTPEEQPAEESDTPITYDELVAMIDNSKNSDALDIASDLVREFPAHQQPALNDMIVKRNKELSDA